MAKGIALIVGLKNVDPNKYNGWNGKNGCWGCERDVDNINLLLTDQGFETKILKTEQATHSNILKELSTAASSLSKDDILVFYYSGHGGQLPDADSKIKDEIDGKDETLVAFDRQIIDDELNEIWLSVVEGARIVMVSDSCNAGTNYKNAKLPFPPIPPTPIEEGGLPFPPIPPTPIEEGGLPFPPIVPTPIELVVNKRVKAQMIHFGGCRDGSSSAGFFSGGAFTLSLCEVLSDKSFQGNYLQVIAKIMSMVDQFQLPKYNEYGNVSNEFCNSRPFQIEI